MLFEGCIYCWRRLLLSNNSHIGLRKVEVVSRGLGIIMSRKEPHQPHTLGAPSSTDIPLAGAKPDQIPCPVCGKSFKTKSEMERHRDTTHHETKGHEF